MKSLSLRGRLTLWYMLALVVVLLLFGLDVLLVQNRLGIRRADRELDSVHATLRNLLRAELNELDSPALAAAEARTSIESLGDDIAILDASGSPLAVQLDHVTLDELKPPAGFRGPRTIRTKSGRWRVHVRPEAFGEISM